MHFSKLPVEANDNQTYIVLLFFIWRSSLQIYSTFPLLLSISLLSNLTAVESCFEVSSSCLRSSLSLRNCYTSAFNVSCLESIVLVCFVGCLMVDKKESKSFRVVTFGVCRYWAGLPKFSSQSRASDVFWLL
jgi:hypothetical protein